MSTFSWCRMGMDFVELSFNFRVKRFRPLMSPRISVVNLYKANYWNRRYLRRTKVVFLQGDHLHGLILDDCFCTVILYLLGLCLFCVIWLELFKQSTIQAYCIIFISRFGDCTVRTSCGYWSLHVSTDWHVSHVLLVHTESSIFVSDVLTLYAHWLIPTSKVITLYIWLPKTEFMPVCFCLNFIICGCE